MRLVKSPNNRALSRTFFVAVIIIIISGASATAYTIYRHRYTADACTTPTPNPYISEYCVINKDSSPNAIATDGQGNVWFVVQNETDLGVLYTNSTMRLFHIPETTHTLFQSWGVVVDNSRNLVWFGDDANNRVWSFNVETRHFTPYNITSSSFAFPYQLVLDSKGDVWFTEDFSEEIGEITTKGQMIQYPLPANLTSRIPYSGPSGLALDKNDSTLWFTIPNANSIGSLYVNPSNSSEYNFKLYNLSGLATQPNGIVVDSQGNIWITQHGPSLVSEFDPKSNSIRSFTTPMPSYLKESLPYFIYIDSQGNIWFNEHYGNAIGELIPSNLSLIEYPIPTKFFPAGNISGAITMNLSPSGTPWFTEWFGGKIGNVNLQVPINLKLSFQNPSADLGKALSFSPSQNLTVDLDILAHSNQSVQLDAYLSTYNYMPTYNFMIPSSNDQNLSQSGFVYSFAPSSGTGNYTTVLNLEDQHVASGTYYITVSAITNEIRVSKIIPISV